MNWPRLVRILTGANSLLFVANIVGGWFLFFTYGRRPDGVEPALHHVLVFLWMLGPLWSIGSFAVALVTLKNHWETWTNAAVCVAYALLWGFLAVM